jgi:integrase
MARGKEPFTVIRRTDSKSYRLTLNSSCGLPERVCDEWYRRSFQHLPAELADHRNPKSKSAAKDAVYALVQYLKKKQEDEGSARRVAVLDITVGAWIRKFTRLETSPRTGINAQKNRPYSEDSVDNYETYYRVHIKDDPLCLLKMAEVEEDDVTDFSTRMSLRKKKDGGLLAGTRTFAGIIIFVRMAFRSYQYKNRRWVNPFQFLDPPKHEEIKRDALKEEEILKLFMPGVLKTKMELAVCATIFLAGLRRSEVSALKPEDLDWHTPKIKVKRAWQNFEKKNKRVLGPPKSKRSRDTPFDPVLQEAIKTVWAENGKHEFVFCKKDGRVIGPSWIAFNFKRWLKRAGIEGNGREIVPHCSRHSLASMLETRKVPLRYIQELLGHSDLKTTIGYLHSTKEMFRAVGERISEAMEKPETKVLEFKIPS